MADKRFQAGPSSTVKSAGVSSASVLVDPTDVDPQLIVPRPPPVLDDEDHSILDWLEHDIVDAVFGSIAQETGDGELLAVLHLTLEILEAEQIFGSVGTLMADLYVPQPTVPEPTVALAVEFTTDSEEESQESDDYGQGDCADAADYFDCFEGAGIVFIAAINKGYVQLKRRS